MAKILYGVGDFKKLREGGGYFVDKTDLIAELEETNFAMFLRPRRFGKSLLASMLYWYYDIESAKKFGELFKGTKIYAKPTDSRGKYLVLYFNLAPIDSNPKMVQESFDECIAGTLKAFGRKYSKKLSTENRAIINSKKGGVQKLANLLIDLRNTKHPVYVIIDEYDRFANTLLAESGQTAYDELCHGDGFFKNFFSILKTESETPESIVERIFITGVSPLVMDDVTSGFNIGTNISSMPAFSQIVGFTHEEISQMLDYYSKAHSFDKALACQTMMDWYDNYRFSSGQKEPVANTTQIIEHMMHLTFNKRPPERPVVANIKQDYAKIKHLVTLNSRLNGSFAKIESILENGGLSVLVKERFQANELSKPENFVSLLYYFGLITRQAGSGSYGKVVIPNATMYQMLGEIAAKAYQDVLGINPRLDELAMALCDFSETGDFNQAKELLADFVDSVFTLRDCAEGEKTVQAILATLLYTVNGPYRCYKEREMNAGYCDLSLFPEPELGKIAEHAAIFEIKYVKKSARASKAILSRLKKEAAEQLETYGAKAAAVAVDWKKWTGKNLACHKYCLIFQGGKLLECQEV